MSNESVTLNTFPSSSTEALAFLFTQNQDLKGKSPKEITEIYYDAYYQIRNCSQQVRREVQNKY